MWTNINTLRPRQNGRHFLDDIFKCIFLNENVILAIEISLKFVPNGPINNIPALVQIMARRHTGDEPLSEPMLVSLPTHICVTRPQWVNMLNPKHIVEKLSKFLLLHVFYISFSMIVDTNELPSQMWSDDCVMPINWVVLSHNELI